MWKWRSQADAASEFLGNFRGDDDTSPEAARVTPERAALYATKAESDAFDKFEKVYVDWKQLEEKVRCKKLDASGAAMIESDETGSRRNRLIPHSKSNAREISSLKELKDRLIKFFSTARTICNKPRDTTISLKRELGKTKSE